jgi:WD40 repeat protein
VTARLSRRRNRPSIQIIERSHCDGLLQLLEKNAVVLFILRYSDGVLADFSKDALEILEHYGIQATIYDVAQDSHIESAVQRFSGWQYFPQLFVRAEFIGGSMILDEYFASGEFTRMTGVDLKPIEAFDKCRRRGARKALWRVSLATRTEVLACARADGHLTIRHLANGTDLSRRSWHQGWVNAVCFDAGEQNIITAGTDRVIRILDISTGRQSIIHEAHERWINDLAPIPNSSRVVSASADQTLALWDVKESLLVARSAATKGAYWCVCALNGGRQIVCGDANGRLLFFEAQDLSFEQSIDAHNNCVVVIVPDWSDGLISGSYDGLVKWIGADGMRQVFIGHRVRVWSVATLPDGRVAAGAADGRILIWHRDRQSAIREICIREVPLSMVWWAHTNCLLVGTDTGVLWQIDPDTTTRSVCMV